MTIRDELWLRLTTGSTSLTGLVGTRVYRDLLPQNVTYPCLAYRRVSGPRLYSTTGAISQATPRFEVACFAKDAGTAESVAEAVRPVLQDWRSSTGSVTVHDAAIQNETDFYDDTLEHHQISIDVDIFHDE